MSFDFLENFDVFFLEILEFLKLFSIKGGGGNWWWLKKMLYLTLCQLHIL